MFEYLPKKRFHEGAEQDIRSKEIIGGLTDCNIEVIEVLADKIGSMIEDNVALVAIPSSKVVNNGKSGVHQLIRTIVKKYGEKHSLVDASSCLYRLEDLPVQPVMSIQKRNKSIYYDTLEVHDPYLIYGRDVIVIDCVTTSGNSLEVGIDLIKRQGAHKVIGLAIGKTISKNNTQYGFIFDLDKTLFDTSSLGDERRLNDWKSARFMAESLQPYIGITDLLDKLKSMGAKICVVTSFPKEFASILVKKIGLSTDILISRYDTKLHKPDLEIYFRAKQKLKTFEQCIVVVGNSYDDILSGKKLGMTTVMAGWGESKEENGADLFFNTPINMLDGLSNVLLNANKLNEILN